MPICKKCNKKISWWSILKGMARPDQTVKCNHCNKLYGITRFSLVILHFLIVIVPLLISFLSDVPGVPLVTFIIGTIIFILLSPFFVRLK